MQSHYIYCGTISILCAAGKQILTFPPTSLFAFWVIFELLLISHKHRNRALYMGGGQIKFKVRGISIWLLWCSLVLTSSEHAELQSWRLCHRVTPCRNAVCAASCLFYQIPLSSIVVRIIWFSNVCQADLRGRPADPPPLPGALDHPSASNVLHTKYFILILFTLTATSHYRNWGVNSNRARIQVICTATMHFKPSQI